MLGILASAFVALITYIGAYNIEKRKTIGFINKYCREYILEWSNLIPLLMEIRPDGVCTFNWNEVINKVKYDVWIQRLGINLYGNNSVKVSGKLSLEVKNICKSFILFIHYCRTLFLWK